MLEINLLNFIFGSFTIVMVVAGGLFAAVEPYLPEMIRQGFRYGKMSHAGRQDPLVSRMEIPKSWFRHFYVFALIWSTMGVYVVVKSYIVGQPVVEFDLWLMDLMAGTEKRAVQVRSTEAFIAMCLIALQCYRRFYETHFVQVFSANSKINWSHYIVGHTHYFAVILAIVTHAEGFIRGTAPRPLAFDDLKIHHFMAIAVFLYSWWHQFQSNLILANLRTDKRGKVVTEQHLIPEGGWFESVSSPHMLFEVLMYFALACLLRDSITMRYALVWVVSNQVSTSWLTHQWYKKTFGTKYPSQRKAIFPGIL